MAYVTTAELRDRAIGCLLIDNKFTISEQELSESSDSDPLHKQAAWNVYKSLIENTERAISRLILGQELLAEQLKMNMSGKLYGRGEMYIAPPWRFEMSSVLIAEQVAAGGYDTAELRREVDRRLAHWCMCISEGLQHLMGYRTASDRHLPNDNEDNIDRGWE